VDNLCGSVGAVVGWAGIQLHDGRIYPLVAGSRPGRPDTQPDYRTQNGLVEKRLIAKVFSEHPAW